MNSMTGYAKEESSMADFQVTVEMKSVNHRFFDAQLKMPKELNSLEIEMKRLLKSVCTRGRIECFINVTRVEGQNKQLKVNWEALNTLILDLDRSKKIDLPFSIGDFLTGGVMHPGLVETFDTPIDESILLSTTLEVFKKSVISLGNSRQKEGQAIAVVLEDQLSLIQEKIIEITQYAGDIKNQHATRLSKKMLELFDEHQVDEARLLTEVALLVERGDITEELDRLSVHVNNMRKLLTNTTPLGKEMDFIIQEMNREVNTIGSKSSVMAIKEAVVSLKLYIEQMREQVQNIE